MSSQLIRSGECRKFSPNIFNKTKCTNCFRQKEEHSAEALESNRSSRKIAKCGYLFVAPGWDFSNPINRTKRWQRRWFVLYDDGELSYSLDEHPETVPQASIDMNKVLEVTSAEELTGNLYSLAITAPDLVHFVKGTSREEARFWTDVLSVFPRSKGRHKRNATFPGPQPSSKSSTHILQTPPIRDSSGITSRNQYNSSLSTPVWEGDDVFPTKEVKSTNNTKVYMGSPPTRDKIDKVDEKTGRSRRVVNREKRGLRTGRSYSEDISKMLPPLWHSQKSDVSLSHLESYETEMKLKDIDVTDSLTGSGRPRVRSISSQQCIEPTRDNDYSSPRQIRGDPDGCGLDPSLSRTSPSDLRLDLVSDELLNIKRGWLMKQSSDKDWNKHWFVLRGNGLLYYRDPKAEDQNILDGVIDLSGISNCTETQLPRNYGFQLTTWDNREIQLSALTGGIRTNWMSAIRKAAGISDPVSNHDLSSPIDNPPATPRSLLFSSDDEYRTASEGGGGGGGRRESGEWGEALPPSPPLNRTPMSRVKERARGVSKWRGLANKRSKSSPPSSRRSTLDSISSQELLSSPTSDSSKLEIKEAVEEPADFITYREKPLMAEEKKRAAALEKKVEDLLKKEEEVDRLRARDSAELIALKSRYIEEKEEWERAVILAESELEETSGRLRAKASEVGEARERAERLAREVSRLEARLASAIEENEALYSRLNPPASSLRTRSVDSLSDLTNIDLSLDLTTLDKERMMEEYRDLRVRFEKAVSEIRALKRELKESQASSDWLELSLVQARQEGTALKKEADASTSLMAARVQDLASKLSASEKQVRQLKTKLGKTETREKRRSLSLKGRESFSLCKELEEKLSELEKKVSCLGSGGEPGEERLGGWRVPSAAAEKRPSTKPRTEAEAHEDRLRRKSLDSATSSEPLKVLLRLRNLEAKLSMAEEKSSEEKQIELKLFNGDPDNLKNQNPKDEMVNEVKKMENLLRAKLLVLAKKKESLINAGQWTNEAKLNLLAEKLAYESVLIGRLHDAVIESKSLDLTDAERLISSLDEKISGGKPNMETSLDYLVKSLAKHLTQQGVKRVSRKPKERKKPDPIIVELLDKKNAIDAKVENYINSVVDQLAEAFAVESLADDVGSNKTDHLQAAWSMAQEAVNQELIQAEISQVLSQCSQTYQNFIENENETRFSGIVKERANLEMWASLADENLKSDMSEAVKKLKTEYMKRLENLKIENQVPVRPTIKDEEKTRGLLNHFVDVVAHKSLLDARVTVLCNGEYSDMEPEQGVFEENSILSEIQFLYVKFCRELTQDSKDEERLKEIVDRLAKEVYALARILSPQGEHSDIPEGSDTWVESLCKKCEHLKEKLISLQSSALQAKDCSTCSLLQQELLRLENHHASEIQELEKRQEKEISRLKEEFEEQKESLMRHYKEEEVKLVEKNERLERRLETWEAEYAQQTEDMKSAFRNLSLADLEDDETMRRRYQAEIQHLKAVCEKGLDCMENAHQRQIQELRDKHERELQALRLEKEQALTEETHATLAALDAMRKAHEAEVQKEVAKFKAEYMNQMQSNHDLSALHSQHQAEMEEIKREILSLSDKYSIKCVESASLEDKLRVANQQLAHAHQHILQLDARNRQLRAHLAGDASTDSLPCLQEHSLSMETSRPTRSPV